MDHCQQSAPFVCQDDKLPMTISNMTLHSSWDLSSSARTLGDCRCVSGVQLFKLMSKTVMTYATSRT